MISLEKARTLKAAGLVWEPKKGDWGFWNNAEMPTPQLVTYNPDPKTVNIKNSTWLPSLSQLLAEIEKHGGCALYVFDSGLHVLEKGAYELEMPKVEITEFESISFRSDTPEDAAASALIWILQNKVGE